MKFLKQPIVPATISVVLAPLMLIVQGTISFLGSMILAEEKNPLWTRVITWVVMFVVACCAIALPTLALIHAIRERKLNSAICKFKTILSLIFAGVAFVVMLLAQVWLLPSLIP